MTIDRDQLVEKAAKAICDERWSYALPHANPSGASWTDKDLAVAVLDAILPTVQAQTLLDAADRLEFLAGRIGKGFADATTLRQFAAEYRKGASDE